MVKESNTVKKKWRPLEKMFNDVPEPYDLLNRIMTIGLDEKWRRLAVRDCLIDNYLAAYAPNFYSPDEVRNMLLEAGFLRADHKALSGGIAGLTNEMK